MVEGHARGWRRGERTVRNFNYAILYNYVIFGNGHFCVHSCLDEESRGLSEFSFERDNFSRFREVSFTECADEHFEFSFASIHASAWLTTAATSSFSGLAWAFWSKRCSFAGLGSSATGGFGREDLEKGTLLKSSVIRVIRVYM